MAFRETGVKKAWEETVQQIARTPANQARYGFYNFDGDRLTKHRLLTLIKTSADSWNNFKKRQKHSIVWYGRGSDISWLPGYIIDLRGLDLSKTDLSDRDLSNIDFSDSNLSGADFSRSRLTSTDITGTFTGRTSLTNCDLRRSKWRSAKLSYVQASGADFTRADLNGTQLDRYDLRGAKFHKALICAEFNHSDVSDADFKESYILSSSFFDTDLSSANNMNLATYHFPCRIDYQTMKLSQTVPTRLLEACGVAHFHFPYIDAISKNAAKLPSCFISYSVRDEEFIQRFRNELANKGVRTWFAPRDLPFGASTRDVIETQIKAHDRLIVILSKSSLRSQWVQFEVETALEMERKKGGDIIIPIAIDGAVFRTRASWGRHIARTKNIALHENWKGTDSSFINEFVRRIQKRSKSAKKPTVGARPGRLLKK
jgi:uncharacterized protein YjbI with pentapeptide repeats